MLQNIFLRKKTKNSLFVPKIIKNEDSIAREVQYYA